MLKYVADRAGRATVLAVLLVCALVAGGVVPIAPATPGELASEPISTRHDDADWVPFIGSFEMWCVQGNPGFAGCANHHNRPAMDIGMPVGTRVRAAGPGRIVQARNVGDGRGTYVVIRHPDGIQSRYYHLRSESVRVGQRVFRGQPIGRSGRSGSSSGPHLHYEEVGTDGRTKEPGLMFAIRGNRVIRYPTVRGTSNWRKVPYGSRIANDRFPPFDDVNPGSRIYGPVRWGAASRVISGYADHTFRARNRIGRAKVLTWLWRGLGRPAPAGEAVFADVPGDASYKAALDWAAGIPGMLDPYVDLFRPGRTVQRVELARFFWAAAGQPVKAPVRTFSDIDDPAVDWIVAQGYMGGYADGTFRGGDAVTRRLAVRVVHRARPFKDVSAQSRFWAAIEWVRWRGYLPGFPDNTFRPKLVIDRGAAIELAWRSQGAPAAGPAPFVDTAGQPYQAATDWGYEQGLSLGYPPPESPSFRGHRAQTRGDWLRVLWGLHGSPVVDDDHVWTDVLPGLDDAADWASLTGVMSGFGDGTFRQREKVTRAQAVRTLNRSSLLPG